MKRYKYVVAVKGQYFAIKGGFRAFKRFNDIVCLNTHESLITLLDALKLNDIHYTIITKEIKNGIL